MTLIYATIFLLMMTAGFLAGRSRAYAVSHGNFAELHSLPGYHGLFVALGVLAPMVLIYLVGVPLVRYLAQDAALSFFPPEVLSDPLQRSVAMRDVARVAAGQFTGDIPANLRDAASAAVNTQALGDWAVIAIGSAAGLIALIASFWQIGMRFRARHWVERFILVALSFCAVVAILTTIGIVFSVVFETYRFFFDPSLKGRPTVSEFLFGLEWNPQAAMRADQGDIKTAFGFVPLLTGTLLITTIAIFIAGPLGVFSAIYLAEYASPRVRAVAKPVLEILAGIPTVVLGFFAALTIAPMIRSMGQYYGLDVASESALAAGLVMGMMIIPFISSLSDDVINAVPQSLRDGAYALGATKSETITQVVLP
ncbi:MAG: phosphate ABC transporter permease family protein, partial [Hyphomicrobiaceae bacterium]|nr:phosphate ABC transporter permease family protein [Hyphomicrobiaceae bacterium]